MMKNLNEEETSISVFRAINTLYMYLMIQCVRTQAVQLTLVDLLKDHLLFHNRCHKMECHYSFNSRCLVEIRLNNNFSHLDYNNNKVHNIIIKGDILIFFSLRRNTPSITTNLHNKLTGFNHSKLQQLQ